MMSLFGSAEHMHATPSPSGHTHALDPAARLLRATIIVCRPLSHGAPLCEHPHVGLLPADLLLARELPPRHIRDNLQEPQVLPSDGTALLSSLRGMSVCVQAC